MPPQTALGRFLVARPIGGLLVYINYYLFVVKKQSVTRKLSYRLESKLTLALTVVLIFFLKDFVTRGTVCLQTLIFPLDEAVT